MFAALWLLPFVPHPADPFPDLPALAHLSRFPSAIAAEQVRRHAEHADWLALRGRLAQTAADRQWWWHAADVVRADLAVWDALADAYDAGRWSAAWWAGPNTDRGRREALGRLRWLIGELRWREGLMPPRMPAGMHGTPRTLATDE